MVLESAAAYNASTIVHEMLETPQLLLYTANLANLLTRMIENYKSWIENNPMKIGDLAYTLALRREHLPHRAFAIANKGVIESVSAPTNLKAAKKPNIVMTFTGQGAQ